MRSKQKINLFGDAYYTPISVNTLTEIILNANSKNLKGIYNISGASSITKHHFGQLVAHYFNLDVDLISKISLDDLNLTANRPKQLALNSSKIQKDLGFSLPSIAEDLKKLKELN